MKTVTYSEKGIAVKDHHVSETVDNFLQFGEHMVTSTKLVIDEIRARMYEGKIKVTDINFFIDDKQIFIKQNGRFGGNAENGFPNVQDNILNRLLGIY